MVAWTRPRQHMCLFRSINQHTSIRGRHVDELFREHAESQVGTYACREKDHAEHSVVLKVNEI